MNILSVLSQKHLRRQPDRSGFTLVELLLAVSIIAILSTLAVGMLRTAQLEARTSATEGRIALIQTILSTYIEDMEFRKLPFRDSDIRNWAGAGATYGEAQALREKILVPFCVESALSGVPAPRGPRAAALVCVYSIIFFSILC